MSDLNEQLLPCPFCGGAGEESYHKPTESYYINCSVCTAHTCQHGAEREEAVAAWNRRAPAAAPAPVAAIPTWSSRLPTWRNYAEPEKRAMLAEIYDLRAALAAVPPAAPIVQPVGYTPELSAVIGSLVTFDPERDCGGMERRPYGDGDYVKIEDVRAALIQCAAAPTPASSTAEAKDAARLLNDDELAALRRFAETCEDDESYDVPKEKMRRLAAIGAIEWKGFSRYQITDFGDFVLDRAAIASSADEVKP